MGSDVARVADSPPSEPPPRYDADRPDGRDQANDRNRGRERGRGRRETANLLRELPVLILIALGLALLIKTFLVQAFYIPSDSMQNTLQIGDRVLVNKLTSRFGEVRRGEVVVFRDPGGWLPESLPQAPSNAVLGAVKEVLVFVGLLPSDSEKDLIKRVIGTPGDRVACCDKPGRISVNDVPLDESYVFPGNPPSDKRFKVTVPPGRLWVMGDHRALSADSRVHIGAPGGGTVPEDRVIGRAVVVVWPYARWQTLPVPETFGQRSLAVATGAGPAVLGLAGAAPLVWWRRRARDHRGRS
jgi:signal peptidase I